MNEVFNFSAGPAVLPKPVLEKAQKELVNYRGSGMSVMELSHRSSLFEEIMNEAEELLRELMAIPDNYRVLFLQGGASLQFSMVPLNLATTGQAAFVNTGSWAKKAISEFNKIPKATAQVIASSADRNFSYIPTIPLADLKPSTDYLHITTNNTIEGTAYFEVPKLEKIPLVADMSSNILSIDYNVEDFGLIYAGAQKNIGPAGLTVVIIRDDLIGLQPVLSSMLDYDVQAKAGSLYNTPPTFAIYMAKLVFEWVKEQGGVAVMQKKNEEKAQLLYKAIDNSSLFSSPVDIPSRSLNNIPFVTGQADLDSLFIKEAQSRGFENLKGHRSVGGMRASLYNAFPKHGVEALVTLMAEFEQQHEGGK